MQSRKRGRANKRIPYVDAIPNGKGYLYFRRNGKRLPLPGPVGSPEFHEAYAAAMRGEAVPERPRAEIERVKSGSFAEIIRTYQQSNEWAAYAAKADRLTAFKRIEVEYKLAPVLVEKMTYAGLKPLIDALAQHKPGAARSLIAAFGCIFKIAKERGLLPANPLAGISKPKLSEDGWYAWTEADVAAFRAFYPLGTMERLALEVFLNTALRCSDARRAGPATLTKDGKIALRQQKLKRYGQDAQVTIPIMPALRAALDAMTVIGTKSWLLTEEGKGFDAAYLSARFRQWCRAVPDLNPEASAHGLRKLCATRLIDAGCTVPQAQAITGHKDPTMLMRYAATRNRERLADDAAAQLQAGGVS